MNPTIGDKPKIKLLTIKEAARLVDGLTEYRIRQLCLSGKLPCFKAGKKYLINENTLIRLVDEIS
jgi:excisionase family DNA binding protein